MIYPIRASRGTNDAVTLQLPGDSPDYQIEVSEIDKAGSNPTITGTTGQDIAVELNNNFFFPNDPLTLTVDDDGTVTDERPGGQQSGLEYAANYSGNYTKRSLPDKEYVDGTRLKRVTVDTAINADSDEVVLVDSIAGAVTISLPDPLNFSISKKFIIKNIENSNGVDVDDNGVANVKIDGQDSITLPNQYDYLEVIGHAGTQNYFITGKNF